MQLHVRDTGKYPSIVVESVEAPEVFHRQKVAHLLPVKQSLEGLQKRD